MRAFSRITTAAVVLAVLSACTDSKSYEAATCALVDVSGTYANQKDQVVKVLKAGILPSMLPGDSLFVLTIDSESYEEKNLVAKLTTDRRPMRANTQKLNFAAKLDEFAQSKIRSRFTDISGAMMLCADYLKQTGAGVTQMFIFSDMKEELPKGVTRSFTEQEFAGIGVAASNVIKLKGDNVRPAVYRRRLKEWQERVMAGGARDWKVIMDETTIPAFIEAQR